MILPGDELTVTIKHIGMRDGNIVVRVETTNARGERVLEGSAEVAQPTTVYVFTGQGSQEPNMGMDLYNSSPAARAVWEGANAHLLAVYGFSIIEIVKDNPKEKTIHFDGIKGQIIRQRYMDMTYDTMDKDGNVKALPLFADINIRTPQIYIQPSEWTPLCHSVHADCIGCDGEGCLRGSLSQGFRAEGMCLCWALSGRILSPRIYC
jgi:fatty acid synthase subunit alpha